MLTHITSREELNYWEQQNIDEAEEWAFRRRRHNIISQAFVCALHKRMFGDVWKWAGQFRNSQKNIGLDPLLISTEMGQLFGNLKAWLEYETYPADEIAARFHHHLVQIHPFPNSNGRHARLMTDLLLVQILRRPRFTWGHAHLLDVSRTREKYITALRAADHLDFNLLLEFVRT